MTSRMASPPSTCCLGPPRRSWPSSAPGASGARWERCPGRGVCFIVPGLILILGLAALFLASRPPLWIEAAAAGAGAAVPAVALQAAISLLPASWKRAGLARPTGSAGRSTLGRRGAAATIGPFLVLLLLACGLGEAPLTATRLTDGRSPGVAGLFPVARRAARSCRRWSGRPGLGRLQGGRTLLRRGLRHHPPHAA